MKICLDLRALQIGHEKRGIGMVVKSFLENLPSDTGHEFSVYAFEGKDPISKLSIKTTITYSVIPAPLINTKIDRPRAFIDMLKIYYHRFSNVRRTDPDIFVQFDFNLGIPRFNRTKNIVIGYDLIPLIKRNEYMPTLRYAWTHTRGKRAKIRTVMKAAYTNFRYSLNYKTFKRADKIICISKDAAKSFETILGIESSKIVVSELAPVIPDGLADLSISDSVKKPYLLYVGGTDSRKNIKDIVYAYNIARGRGANFCLVLAGNEFSEVKKLPDVDGRNAILNSPYNDDIHLVGYVNDQQKKGLYEKAFAFLFCSSYEGFGLPVIEAMSMKCPVICYDNSSIPEAAGDAALMVQTGDFVAIAHQILNIEKNDLRNLLIARGETQASKFSWEKYVDTFFKIVES